MSSVNPVLRTLPACLGLGLLGGALWNWWWTPPMYDVREGLGSLGEVALGEVFSSDAWFFVIGVGLAFGFAVVHRARTADSGLPDLVLALLGIGIAAAVMSGVGGWLGPDNPTALFRTVEEGARVPAELDLSTWTAYLGWPLGLLAGWWQELWWPFLSPHQTAAIEADSRVAASAQQS